LNKWRSREIGKERKCHLVISGMLNFGEKLSKIHLDRMVNSFIGSLNIQVK
jgi:hypothetical protein